MTIYNEQLSKLPQPERLVTISEGAIKRLKVLQAEKGAHLRLRFWVEGGGCSGFQTRFKLDEMLNDDDLVFEDDGVFVVVDNTSYEFLEGATVEYTDNLMGSWFHLTIPKADSSCSCGSSFSVQM